MMFHTKRSMAAVASWSKALVVFWRLFRGVDINGTSEVVLCPTLVETEGLTITYPDGRKTNGSATFHCAEPYRRKGSPIVTCLADGEWSEPSPYCTLPTCSVDSLLNALPETATINQENVNTETLPYGTALKIICQDDNQQIIGDKTATCKESGKWDFGEIKCIHGCGIAKLPEESTLIIEPIKDNYRFGDSLVFTCHPGQKLTPNVQRVICFQNGWSDKFPECIDNTQDVKLQKPGRRTL